MPPCFLAHHVSIAVINPVGTCMSCVKRLTISLVFSYTSFQGKEEGSLVGFFFNSDH